MSSMDSGDCETEEDSAPEACVSPEGPQLPSNSREMRNKAEKMRRDKLNSYISELACLVPLISKSPKRMDKTSILRLTATHLRIYQTLQKSKNKMDIPRNIDQCILENLVYEQLGGFLLILTANGKVVFASHTVENILGHLQTDLMGQSIFNITAQEDHERFKMYITTDELSDKDWRKYFNIRLKRAGPRSESPVYETVNVMGMQRVLHSNDNEATGHSRDLQLQQNANNDMWIFFVRLQRPEPITDQLMEASKDEYVTRHLVDGRIINCDQRISFIAGYMIEEVSGLSAFKFMHREDVRWVIIALRQMYDKGESRGSSCYRLLSRTGQFIYLRTFGFLEVDSTGTVESFICVNSLVNAKEGEQLIKEMKERYSALIKSTTSKQLLNGIEEKLANTVEDPLQLEAAIAHLVTNLPSPESEITESPSSLETQDCPTTPSTDYSSSSNSPHTPKNHVYNIKVKTASKRSAGSADSTSNTKRSKCEIPLNIAMSRSPSIDISPGSSINYPLSPTPSYQGSTINHVYSIKIKTAGKRSANSFDTNSNTHKPEIPSSTVVSRSPSIDMSPGSSVHQPASPSPSYQGATITEIPMSNENR